MNCTALPATLMEAELFGHERGAFTDAKESRMGLFEAAEGGFLFLDEVGDVELVAAGQAAARRSRSGPCGGSAASATAGSTSGSSPPPIAISSATRSGSRFRRDLYFRLAVIILHLPPLRERGDDMLLLAQHFLERFSAKYGKDVRQIDAARPRRCCPRIPGPATCGS